MNIALLSSNYNVRRLNIADVQDIYSLCIRNESYYRYCPPFVTKHSILNDMKALPDGKDISDKYYIGYYNGKELIAVMDLIMSYPKEQNAFIGFFMTSLLIQNTGIGSCIIDELCQYMKKSGITGLRLGWAKGNLHAKHFWHKNGFQETGITYNAGSYTVVLAHRNL